jgi:hypothetical protein
MRRAAPLLTLVIAAASLCAYANERGPLPIPEQGFDFRQGIHPQATLEELLDKPTILEIENYLFTDGETGERRMAGYVDIHAVYDIGIEYLISAVVDFNAYPGYAPRIFSARITEASDDRYLLHFTVGISFLGFRVAYETIEETIITRHADGSLFTRSRLIDSPDGNLFEHYMSMYLSEVRVNGKTMTYIRYYNRPGLRKPFPGMLAVAKTFTPGESRHQLNALAGEAERRAKAAR